jgi:hypothetical protein
MATEGDPMGHILAERLGVTGWNLLGASRALLATADAVRALNRRLAETSTDQLQLIPVYEIAMRPKDGSAHACPCSDGCGYFVPLDVDLNRPGRHAIPVDVAGPWPAIAQVGAA